MSSNHKASEKDASTTTDAEAVDLLHQAIIRSSAALQRQDVREWILQTYSQRGKEPIEQVVYWSERLPLDQPSLGQEADFAASDIEQWSNFEDFCHGDVELAYVSTALGDVWMGLPESLLEEEGVAQRIVECDYLTLVLRYKSHAFMKVLHVPER